ncbi:MAG: prolyl oligopeptidase family serine peptidase [Acidobacteriaceae bacterium]
MLRTTSAATLLIFVAAVPFSMGRAAAAQSSGPQSSGQQSSGTQNSAAPTSKRAMQFEDLQKMRRLGDLALSPDGRWVLFSVTDVDLSQNRKTSHLWVVPTGEGSRPAEEKPVTASMAGESRGRFSPDSKQVAFISAREGAPQIYLADFDDKSGNLGAATKLTAAAMGVDGAMWSPDGQSILYTSSVYPECAAGSQQEQCNTDRQHAEVNSKVKAQIFTHLLYRHWNAFTGDTRSHLFLLPVSGGTARDLTPGDPHDVPPFALGGPDAYAFSPDGKELAFEENLDPVPAISTHVDIWTLDLTNPSARPVKISTSAGGNFSPAYSPDGKWIAWRSQARAGYESDKFRLVVYDRATKQLREVLPNFDRWVDEFVWAPDSQTIYLTSGHEGEQPLLRTTLDGKLTRMTALGEFGDLHVTQDGKALLATRMTVRMPSEVEVVDLSNQDANESAADTRSESDLNTPVSATPGRPLSLEQAHGARTARLRARALPWNDASAHYRRRQLTHLNAAVLQQLDLPEMERYWFAGAGRRLVEGFVIRPPGFDASKKYPVKFLIHGGPEGAWGDSWSYRWNPELFAADGYVVVMVNPRGSTGYGQAFTDGVNGDWGGKAYIDLMRGLDSAELRYPFIDKTRECALGASYGGYMADWILGHTDRFKCIVSHDGMFNPESAYGTTEELWFNEWEFKGTPWSNRLNYRRWSPMLSETRFKTPTLVVHSQLDYRLDVSEGLQLFTTLQRMNVPSKMLYFPDEGHWVQKPQNSQLWYKTVNDWCDQWTRTSPGSQTNDNGTTGLRTQH